MNKLHTSWELAQGLKTTILGRWWVGGWSTISLIIRLSQTQAGAWAFAWAELGNMAKATRAVSVAEAVEGVEMPESVELVEAV